YISKLFVVSYTNGSKTDTELVVLLSVSYMTKPGFVNVSPPSVDTNIPPTDTPFALVSPEISLYIGTKISPVRIVAPPLLPGAVRSNPVTKVASLQAVPLLDNVE